MLSRALFPACLVLVGVFAACENPRDPQTAPVPYRGAVEALLEARCVRCHADLAPAGGWRADSYLGAIGCVASGEPAALPRVSGGATLVELVFERSDHAALITSEERALLASWVASGAVRSRPMVHDSAFADPRSPASHGRLLRSKKYGPMLDANDRDACGACHDGVASRPDGVVHPAPNAPACTTCHRDPGGPLACSTCHGSGARESGSASARSYPPRDPCFFAGDPIDRAHAAHVGAAQACATCHPEPAAGRLDGHHANGHVEIWFDYARAGREARFDQTSGRCSGTCHDHGGARPTPSWRDEKMSCNDCHGAPPAGHYRGTCTSCHREANADGTALSSRTLHVNGKVDLGDGSGRCGACHGRGDDPWPDTGAHRAHAQPSSAAPVACETCHVLPDGAHPTGKGTASVRLGGLATKGGRRATYDPATKSCASTYCHEGVSALTPAPRWDGGGLGGCNACHGAPPPPPHSQSATCSGATCHGGSIAGGTFTPAGRAAHANGLVDRGL